MSDQVPAAPTQKPLLTQSKFYTLARTMPLLDSLVPNLPTQMAVEVQVNEIFPREPSDNDDTRILINYTNIKGHPNLYKLNDSERLTRRFDLDDFMNGFAAALGTGSESDNQTQIVTSIMSALNMSVSTLLGTTGGRVSQKLKDLSSIILHSIIAVLYNDALDVIIVVEEHPSKVEGEPSVSLIVGLWIVKQRHTDDITDEDLLSADTVNGLKDLSGK